MEPLRVAHIPPRPGPRDEVRRLDAGENFLGVICSKDWWGVWTHWNGDRSQPCLQEKGKCGGCALGFPARWKGYLHVLVGRGPEDCFLELTPCAADAVNSALPAGTDLRGYVLRVERGKGRKARLKVSINPGRVDSKDLPPAKDPEPVLRTLWNMPNRRSYAANALDKTFSQLDRSARL